MMTFKNIRTRSVAVASLLLLLGAATTTVSAKGGLQDKANSQGSGGSGITPIYSGQCIPFERVSTEASKTTGRCKTNDCPDGCCRYHTAFLTCDTSNVFPQQPCVCNDRVTLAPVSPPTRATRRPATAAPISPPAPAPTSDPDKATTDGGNVTTTTSSPAAPFQPLTNAPVQSPTNAPVQPLTNAPDSAATGVCAQGSDWWDRGFPFTQCAQASDCRGVLNNGRPTCCKKIFCLCDAVQSLEECVA